MKKNIFFLFIKVFVTVVILFYLLDYLDFDQLKISQNTFQFDILLISIIILITSYFFVSLRLRIVTQYKVNFYDVFRINIISSFFSNLNSAGSELVRIFMLKKKVNLVPSITYIFCDRIIGVLSKFIIIFLGFCFFAKIKLYIILVFSIFILIFSYFTFYFIFPKIIFFLNKISIIRKINLDKNIFYQIADLKNFQKLFLLSFICHFLQILFIYTISINFDEKINLIYTSIIGPISMALSSLPISFGGWGIREIALIKGYNYFDVLPETSFLISISIGIINLVTSFCLTIIFLTLSFFKKNEKK